jgi:hypothetical protein
MSAPASTAAADPGAPSKSQRGGWRPGAGRKPKPKPDARQIRVKVTFEIIMPDPNGGLLAKASPADLRALHRVIGLCVRAEKIASAIIAPPPLEGGLFASFGLPPQNEAEAFGDAEGGE